MLGFPQPWRVPGPLLDENGQLPSAKTDLGTLILGFTTFGSLNSRAEMG